MCALYKGIDIPDNDVERVESLKSYHLLDTSPEPYFDDITELAATICGCMISYISLIDEKRQWLKSKYGLPADFFERPREMTLCAPTICQNDVLIIPDLSKNERYADLPSVTGPMQLRFYCGIPLVNPEGYAIGTFCVMHNQPREPAPEVIECVRKLSRQVVANLELHRKLIQLREANDALADAKQQIQTEVEKSDELLRNILPAGIAEELKAHGRVEPRYHPDVTILFTDFVSFTQFAESVEPKALVDQLNDHFTLFDEITERHSVEKLKTNGDQFLAVAGLAETTNTHAKDACLAAIEIRDAMARINRERAKLNLAPWNIRIGLHTGPVMAGVVGAKKFAFDIWGDAVNIAARMEEGSDAGRINVSEGTYRAVIRHFDLEPRGTIEVKNKGSVNMYFLNNVKAEPVG